MNKKRGALWDTEYMLEQWGWWRMSGMGVPRYVSPSFALMRDNVQQHSSISFSITDELAMSVDSAVARLTAREKQHGVNGPFMGDCLWLYFGAKWTAVRVGKHHGISEAKARELIKAGVAWVDSALESTREAA
ncbi:antitermination protein Q [Pseudomonas aeruginosa]|uniref:antitermination protein Q n=1 Tax=Pseudomonas aeruginosa TaxID=287 RepID=UPI000FF081D7|nr:antitermination protein Q [Pseudomonas aeruginosa]RPW28502.1 antitermination protein Q [Pseudomonas aeruginosa]WRS36182.1 antitermination protein Q [Pseudomonas aeruginosa]